MHEGVKKQPGVRISSKDVALTYAKTRLRSNSEFYRKSHNVGVQSTVNRRAVCSARGIVISRENFRPY